MDNLCLSQVDKLKVLLESLANSTSKAEKRISEHRLTISLPPVSFPIDAVKTYFLFNFGMTW